MASEPRLVATACVACTDFAACRDAGVCEFDRIMQQTRGLPPRWPLASLAPEPEEAAPAAPEAAPSTMIDRPCAHCTTKVACLSRGVCASKPVFQPCETCDTQRGCTVLRRCEAEHVRDRKAADRKALLGKQAAAPATTAPLLADQRHFVQISAVGEGRYGSNWVYGLTNDGRVLGLHHSPHRPATWVRLPDCPQGDPE